MQKIIELINEEFKERKNLGGNWEAYEVEEYLEEIKTSLISKVQAINVIQCCVNKDLDKQPIKGVNETMQIDDDIRNVPLVICKKCGSSEMYQYTKLLDKCEVCGHTQNY